MKFDARTWVLAIGIVLLLIGLFGMLISSTTVTYRTVNQIVAYAGRDKPVSAEVSAYFERGDNITVDFRLGPDWDDGIYDESPLEFPGMQIKIVIVEVTDPNDNRTPFLVTIGKYPGGVNLAKLKVEVQVPNSLNVTDNNSLNVTDNTEETNLITVPEIGWIATHSGVYKAQVWRPIPSKPDVHPPTYVALNKHYVETSYPLAYLLPVGASVTVVSIILITWSIKKPKRPFLRRRTK